MLRQSLSCKRVSALVFPLAYRVNHRYQDSIIFSIIDHSKSLCSRFNLHDTDIQPWRGELILEIKTRLNEHEGRLELKSLTGWMDFASATNAFSR